MTIHVLRPPKLALAPVDDLMVRAQRVAAIAAQHADAVDRDGRFPTEAFEAARTERLLGVMVPRSLGGEEASVQDIVDVCYTLGQACSSTAMIYAMHQVKVACVIRHGVGAAWHEGFLRALTERQLLVASSTTEGQGGGNVRSSEAPVIHSGDMISLERMASVISYGEAADAVVTTARRAPDADGADQVLVVLLKKDYSLERTLNWDTLGMRGTCSAGFTLRTIAHRDQILPVPYAAIHTQSMVPAAHLMWSGVWAGIAAGAVDRARRYTRKAARGADGQLPPGAAHYTRAHSQLRALRALIAAMLARYEAIRNDPAALSSIDFQTAINLLKVDVSEQAVTTVMSALRACGLSGYRNDTDVSIGRSLRDVLSSPLMISNDRILASIGASAMLSDIPHSIRD